MDQLTSAVAAEIRAEIAAQHGSNAKAAAELADVPYGTLGRYLREEREIPISTLGQVLIALRLPLAEFWQRVEQRMMKA